MGFWYIYIYMSWGQYYSAPISLKFLICLHWQFRYLCQIPTCEFSYVLCTPETSTKMRSWFFQVQSIPIIRVEISKRLLENQMSSKPKHPIPWGLVFRVVKQILSTVLNKTESQPQLTSQCQVAVSFQQEQLASSLVYGAILPWVHHPSWRIFTMGGRDVIWSSIQRPSGKPQCTKKTHFHVKTSAISHPYQSQVDNLPKALCFLWKTCVLLVRAAGPSTGDVRRSVLRLLIRLSLCVASHSASERTAIAELKVHWFLQSVVYFCFWIAWRGHSKPCVQRGPESSWLCSKACSDICLIFCLILGTYWSELVRLFCDSLAGKIKWSYSLNTLGHLNSHHILTLEVPYR